MGKIYRSITELVGKTPLLELANYEKKHDLPAKLLVKLESQQPKGINSVYTYRIRLVRNVFR